ncbi:MAG: 5-formyltetrahydrofolate cyclo-ligase [Rubricoccaceae bacterium]
MDRDGKEEAGRHPALLRGGAEAAAEEARDAAERAALRARLAAARLAVPPGARAAAHAAIVRHVLRLHALRRARLVHVFWPLLGRGEVDTRPLIAALRARGVGVVLPVVRPGGMLGHRLFEGEARLVPGPWGLLEPSPGAPEVRAADLDVVLVPGLAFSRDGHRLGYGGGFYDRFLPQTPAQRIGLVMAYALVDALPHAPHDVPVGVIVTEHGPVRVPPPEAPIGKA